MCFTEAKHYFLRSGRVPSRVFFLFFFRPIISSSFFFKSGGFVASQGLHSAANGSLLGGLEGTNLATVTPFDSVPVPRCFPGPQKESFGVTLGCLLDALTVFSVVFFGDRSAL